MMCQPTTYSPVAISCFFPVTLEKRKTKQYDKFELVVKVVSDVLNVTPFAIKGKGRKVNYVDARYISIHFILKYYPCETLATVGAHFNLKHDVVIYARDTFEDRRLRRDFRNKVRQVEAELKKIEGVST